MAHQLEQYELADGTVAHFGMSVPDADHVAMSEAAGVVPMVIAWLQRQIRARLVHR